MMADLTWSDAQWQKVNDAVNEAFGKASVASAFLPLYGPLPGGTETVRNERLRHTDKSASAPLTISGGPCVYKGRDMKTVHRGMGITESDWKIAVALFTAALNKNKVAPREGSEFVQIIEDMKGSIVEVSGPALNDLRR
jgi:hypothetical protein